MAQDFEADAKAIVRTVLAHVSRLDSDITDYSHFDRLPVRVISDPTAGTVSVIWSAAHLIYRSDGSLKAFHLYADDDETLQRRVRAEKQVDVHRARQMVDEYRRLFGDVGQGHIWREDRGFQNGLEVFTFEWTALVHRLPLAYQYSGQMVIDASRGQLLLYRPPSVPSLLRADDPTLPLDRLRAAALDHYANNRPFLRGVLWAETIHLEVPRFQPPPEPTEEMLQLAQSGTAMPIYLVWIADEESVDPETGIPGSVQEVYLDARSGRLTAHYFNGVLRPSLPRAREARSPWRPGNAWRVAGLRSALPGRLSPVNGPQATGPGRSIVLASGKDLILAFFDEISGLVWREENGRRDFARPDATLRAALRR